MVLRRGKVGVYLQKLISELRVLLYPYCAINLKEKRKNSLRDFLSLVDLYNLSHMFAITNTDHNSYMRLSKMPSGPTFTFKIDKYCLSSDILNESEVKKPLTKSFHHIPLLILNGFNSTKLSPELEEPVKLVGNMFQSIFPPLNLNEIDVKLAKRIVLINLNTDNENPIFEIRHYDIDIEKISSKKTISNIINSKKTDFTGYNNIAEYILKQTGYTDNSDNEGDDNNVSLILNENKDKAEEKHNKIKLFEIGPRINLSLHKIEEGFFKGNVAYHNIVKKSKKEILEKSKELKEKRQEKKKRREEQEKNVQKKEELRQSLLTEEEKQDEREKKEKKERMLQRKREADIKVKKEADKQRVINKREMKHLKNLKKGK